MDFDGFLRFFLPENPEFVSGSLANHWGYDESKQPPIEVPVKKLSTIMKELGHRQIDLLKLDIEGAEYAVLNDIISQSVDIKQIVVEFHHRFNGYKSNTVKTVRKLKKKGFKLFAISESKEEYSFLKMP